MAQASDRWIAPLDSGGRSLTSCCETTSVLADASSRAFADVAQQEERDHAMVEATSSRLVIRSTSGVSLHSVAAARWCWRRGMCAAPGRATCSETPRSTGRSRLGTAEVDSHALVAQQAEQPPCNRQAARSIRRRGHQTCRVRLAGLGHRAFNPGTRVRIPHATPEQGTLVELTLRGWKSTATIGRCRNP